MTGSETPVRKQTARRLVNGKARGYDIALLYPDKLTTVKATIIDASARVGIMVLLIAGAVIPPHVGPGVLGILIGYGAGYLIGSAIARSRAATKVAAAISGSADAAATYKPSSDVTVIRLFEVNRDGVAV